MLLLGVVALRHSLVTSPIPRSIQRSAHFALYYPAKLPSGWTLDKRSFDFEQNVVLYVLKSPQGSIVVSQQPKDSAFDYAEFYEKTLRNSFRFSTPLGTGAIGKSSTDNYAGSLIIDKTWVLASASSSKIQDSDLQFILSKLKKL